MMGQERRVTQIVFKNKLDKFLWTVADEPLFCGYTARRRAESNSLQHMIRVHKCELIVGHRNLIIVYYGIPQYHVGLFPKVFLSVSVSKVMAISKNDSENHYIF